MVPEMLPELVWGQLCLGLKTSKGRGSLASWAASLHCIDPPGETFLLFNLNLPRCSPWPLSSSPASRDLRPSSSSIASPFCLVSTFGIVGVSSLAGLGVASEDFNPKKYIFFNKNKHRMLLFLLLAWVSAEVCSVPSSWVGDCRCPTALK